MTGANREAVIDFEFLRGRQTVTVVKELCVVSATASKTFGFKSPYNNGINWADGHIEYKELHTMDT